MKPSDNLTEDGANRIARLISNYWAWRGGKVTTRVEHVPGSDGMYGVRSDMVNGLPTARF